MNKVSNKRTDPELERRIVTLIARGYTYPSISLETDVPVSTIKKISKRNQESIAKVKAGVVRWQIKSARRILEMSHKEIEKKLDLAMVGEEDIPIRDLVSISKEMFSQSQVEDGKCSAVVASQAQTEAYTSEILHALQVGDEVELQRILFRKTDRET